MQNTFAAGNRVLDILDEKPVTEDITGYGNIDFAGAKSRGRFFAYGDETIFTECILEMNEKPDSCMCTSSRKGMSIRTKELSTFSHLVRASQMGQIITIKNIFIRKVTTNFYFG